MLHQPHHSVDTRPRQWLLKLATVWNTMPTCCTELLRGRWPYTSTDPFQDMVTVSLSAASSCHTKLRPLTSESTALTSRSTPSALINGEMKNCANLPAQHDIHTAVLAVCSQRQLPVGCTATPRLLLTGVLIAMQRPLKSITELQAVHGSTAGCCDLLLQDTNVQAASRYTTEA